MKVKLTLEIRDLHADPGDRLPKKLEIPKDVFSQADVTITEQEIDKELAERREKAGTVEKKRIQIQPLIAFREDKTFRLGGPHGKIMGLFKEAGSALYNQKIEGFKTGYKSLLKSLIIKPQWMQLEEAGTITVNKIPQIVAGRSKALIMQYYEQMDKCKAHITIEMPSGVKDKFEKILEQSEGMPFGPKRRGEIKVLNKTWTN